MFTAVFKTAYHSSLSSGTVIQFMPLLPISVLSPLPTKRPPFLQFPPLETFYAFIFSPRVLHALPVPHCFI